MIDVLKKAALNGGEVLKKYFHQEELDISHKTNHQNIVTKADVEAQTVIHTTILEEMTKLGISEEEIGFIGEEKLHKVGKHTFIIDPLDGTSNFATGFEEFGVLIGYMNDAELLAGVIYFPLRDELFTAEKGKGAFMEKNNKKILLKPADIDLHDTFILTSLSYADDLSFGIDKKIMALKNEFRGVRLIGSAASDFKYMLEGVGGMVLIGGCSIWDLAAGKIVLKEAGIEMYDRKGNELVFDLSQPEKKYPFFGCRPSKKEAILKVLGKIG